MRKLPQPFLSRDKGVVRKEVAYADTQISQSSFVGKNGSDWHSFYVLQLDRSNYIEDFLYRVGELVYVKILGPWALNGKAHPTTSA